MIAVAALPAMTESGLPIRFSPRKVFDDVFNPLFCLTVASISVYFPPRSSNLAISIFLFQRVLRVSDPVWWDERVP